MDNDVELNFTFLDNLSIIGEELIDIIRYLPQSAHCKDIKTGKYILSNNTNAKIYEIDASQLVGLAVDDIEDDEYVEVVKKLDSQVKIENSKIEDQPRIVVNRTGILRLQTMLKVPVRGLDRHSKYILTICNDVINKKTPYQLLNLYLMNYTRKVDAVQFLKHIKIDHYFKFHNKTDYPSVNQLIALLKLAEFSNYKLVSKALNVSYKSIESFILNIKNKMHHGTIEELLFYLNKKILADGSIVNDDECLIKTYKNP